MNHCKLLICDVRTYPNTVIATYNSTAAIAALQKLGVTEYGLSERTQSLPGRHFYSESYQHVHKEVWFKIPDEKAFCETHQLIPRSDISCFIEKALKTALNMDNQQPGISLVNWHPNAGLIFSEASKLAGYLDIEIEDFGIVVGTRENGDVGDETPGAEDIGAVKKFAAEIKKQFPGLVMEYISCDEFTEIAINYCDMDSVKPESVRAPPQLRDKKTRP